MGTEQQQELKSEKPRHKSMPKNIPFTDHSIENFKLSIITRKIEEEKEEITYTWDEPRVKDPEADYKPGRFKHLDEAIRNTRKK